MNLRVNEIFGPTIQGEGPLAGRNATFLRLAGCNLDCAWCDTPYTWDWTGKNGVVYDRMTESHLRSQDEVLAELMACGLARNHLLVVTGGEPLLQRRAMTEFVTLVLRDHADVQIETNGTQLPLTEDGPLYVVSPKLANAGIVRARRHKPEVLAAFAQRRAVFKFVASSPADVEEIAQMVGPDASNVWVMPEGRRPSEVLDGARAIADEVIGRGWHLSLRSHTLLWGEERCR